MTNNLDYSKRLRKGDDSVKELIIEVLGRDNTYGFDLDSIYYISAENKWIIIEFLKTDHKSVSPPESHPSRYWGKNWRKFASLWRLVEHLKNGGATVCLYLVNYEDEEHARLQGRSEREFCVIEVKEMIPTARGGITEESSQNYNFKQFQDWFQEINRKAGER